jgi:hypothetical protein
MKNKGKVYIEPIFSALLVILFLAAGCAGGPQVKESQPPEWVLTQPTDDETYAYFVGYGTSGSGDMAEARNIATAAMLDEILRFLGVRVTSETTAEARGSLDSFKADITQIVRQTGAAKITGFTITDTWADKRKEPAVTLYVLGRYDRKELLKEKENIEKLFIEEDRAISVPESEGKSLAAERRYYEAAIKFITAAGAALKSKVGNADIKYKRNLDQAMESIENINLIKLNDNIEGMAGEELPELITLKVVDGADRSDHGIPGASLIISYQELNKASGKMRFKETEMKSDENGVAAFRHPIPEFVGSSRVSFSLDLSSYLRILDSAEGIQRDQVDGLEELLVRKKATFIISAVSNAQNILTGVFIMDYNKAGEPAGTQSTSNALVSELSEFRLTTMTLTGSEGKSEAYIIGELKKKYGDRVERLLIGTVRIVEIKKSSGKFLAKAAGSVKVLEIATGDLLFSDQMEKSGLGNNEDDASSRAYKEIGKLLGKSVRNNLR